MALINIRVDDSLKENVETILEDMGLNMTTAITIYLKEIVRSKQIPFTIVSSINNIEENVSSKEETVDETYNKIIVVFTKRLLKKWLNIGLLYDI